VMKLAAPKFDDWVFSSNLSEAFFLQFGLPIVTDRNTSWAGPLVGLACMMA